MTLKDAVKARALKALAECIGERSANEDEREIFNTAFQTVLAAGKPEKK